MVGISRYHLLEPVHIHTWMQRQKQINLHLPLKSKFHCIIFRAREFSIITVKSFLSPPLPHSLKFGLFSNVYFASHQWCNTKILAYWKFHCVLNSGRPQLQHKAFVKDLLADMGSTASCLILCETTVVHKTWPLNWSQDIQSFFFFLDNFSLVCLNIVENDIQLKSIRYQLYFLLVVIYLDFSSFYFLFLFFLPQGEQKWKKLILHLFTVHRNFFHVGMDNVFHLTNSVILHLTVQIAMMKPSVVSENFNNLGCQFPVNMFVCPTCQGSVTS